MIIKTLQWNVGGCRFRDENANPLEDVYTNTDVEYFVNYINTLDPDIVTLQESHLAPSYSFAEQITKGTKLKYYADFDLAQSHIDENYRLAISLISKYPLLNIQKTLFINPNYTFEWKDKKWLSHDKGILSAKLQLPEGTMLSIATTHLLPFRKYGVELNSSKLNHLKSDIESKLLCVSKDAFILQGDFNLDSENLELYFPNLINNDVCEVKITKPTSPRGRKYDHIIYKSLRLNDFHIDSTVLTGHFALNTLFEL